MFAGKAREELKVALLRPYSEIETRLVRLARDKHSSLLGLLFFTDALGK
jgi:hypothetical protein